METITNTATLNAADFQLAATTNQRTHSVLDLDIPLDTGTGIGSRPPLPKETLQLSGAPDEQLATLGTHPKPSNETGYLPPTGEAVSQPDDASVVASVSAIEPSADETFTINQEAINKLVQQAWGTKENAAATIDGSVQTRDSIFQNIFERVAASAGQGWGSAEPLASKVTDGIPAFADSSNQSAGIVAHDTVGGRQSKPDQDKIQLLTAHLASAANAPTNSWAMASAMLDFYLSSNSAAGVGGDLAQPAQDKVASLISPALAAEVKIGGDAQQMQMRNVQGLLAG